MERKKKKPSAQRPKTEHKQEAVYIPPVPLNRKKFLLRLATVAAVVLAVFVSLAIFFRVDEVVVSGISQYSAWTVKEASGIQEGDSLLSFGKAAAAGRIMEKLRYVKSVRISVTLPDTVNIYVEETAVTYAVQDREDIWWLIASDGRVIETVSAEEVPNHTQLTGFRLDTPRAGEKAVAWEDGATDVTNSQRLQTALDIARNLELNEILGEAASINMTNPGNIQLWYGTRYQVQLGSAQQLEKKVAMLKSVIDRHQKEGGHQSGILDVSLTTYPESVSYTPF